MIKHIMTYVGVVLFASSLMVSCEHSQSTENNNDTINYEVPTYGVSYMKKVGKDTIPSREYRMKVKKKELPPLTKFSKTKMKNVEECKVNNYYVYYDSVNYKMYNVKELIQNRDTSYVIETKILK